MDKIRALLEQMGGSKELGNQIVESLEQYRQTVQQEAQNDYRQRLEKAKTACLEEVENYKRDLAKKMQVFFESRVEKIEQQIAKQVAIKDSAAEAKLQAIAAILEGIEANSNGNNAELRAALKQVNELQEQTHKSEHANKILTEKATRAQNIAEKTLERNKILSKELVESKKVAEGKIIIDKTKGKDQKVVSEGRSEAKDKPITEDRKTPDPTTIRKARQDQIAKEQKPGAPAPLSTLGGYDPAAIAEIMG